MGRGEGCELAPTQSGDDHTTLDRAPPAGVADPPSGSRPKRHVWSGCDHVWVFLVSPCLIHDFVGRGDFGRPDGADRWRQLVPLATTAARRTLGRVAIITDEQARAVAAQGLADIINEVEADIAFSVYGVLDKQDWLLVGRHLIGPISEALAQFNAGDRSPGVVRLALAAHDLGT